jgi:hypothetical protein
VSEVIAVHQGLALFRRRRTGAAATFVIIGILLLMQSREKTRSAAPAPPSATTSVATQTGSATNVTTSSAFAARQSNVWVETSGLVQKLLADDTETRDGSDKHQRFLVRTDDGVTVLVAHNLGAAERVPAKVGDRVQLRGEYEWSDKGGTIHFTHSPKYKTRDPNKSGWIEHAGIRYE